MYCQADRQREREREREKERERERERESEIEREGGPSPSRCSLLTPLASVPLPGRDRENLNLPYHCYDKYRKAIKYNNCSTVNLHFLI